MSVDMRPPRVAVMIERIGGRMRIGRDVRVLLVAADVVRRDGSTPIGVLTH